MISSQNWLVALVFTASQRAIILLIILSKFLWHATVLGKWEVPRIMLRLKSSIVLGGNISPQTTTVQDVVLRAMSFMKFCTCWP